MNLNGTRDSWSVMLFIICEQEFLRRGHEENIREYVKAILTQSPSSRLKVTEESFFSICVSTLLHSRVRTRTHSDTLWLHYL